MKQLEGSRLEPIPHPPRWPLLGNLLDVMRKPTFIESLTALSDGYGPLIELAFPGRMLLLASNHAFIQEICDDTRFEKAVDGPAVLARETVGDGLFTAYNDEPAWGVAHNILMPAFSQKAMQGYVSMMTDITRQLLHRWDTLPPGAEIQVSEDMIRLSFDTIALCGFGSRLDSFQRSEPHPFVQALMRVLAKLQAQSALPLTLVKLMHFVDRQFKRDATLMNGLVDDIIRRRRENPAAMAESRDLLSAMLTGVDSVTGGRISDTNARYQAITFLVAGHESTSALLTFTLHLLMQHPQFLARAYEEVDRVLGTDLTREPTYPQLMEMKYCRQVLMETLRLWPPFPQFARCAKADTILGGKYLVRARQPILLNVFALQRDKEAWGEDADQFNPDRFLPEQEANRKSHAFLAFGTGPRACIGRQFAMVEATLVLAMLLQRYRFHGDPDYRLQIVHSLSLKPHNFKIRIEKRTERTGSSATPPTVSVSVPSPSLPSPSVPSLSVPSPVPTVSTSTRHGTPLWVLYGSNMGSASDLAAQLADQANRQGFVATAASLDSVADRLPKTGAMIVISATYNGHPPDNAVRFIRWLRDGARTSSELEGVRYAVFGCGHSDWAATFQAVPRLLDDRLAELGATRLMPRGEGDAGGDFEGAFSAWKHALWQSLAEAFRLESLADEDEGPSAPLYAIDLLEDRGLNDSAATFGTVSMEVLENRELQRQDGDRAPDRSTRHLEISLPAGMSYRAGDHLGVMPRNGERLVGRVAARFKLGRETQIRLRLQAGTSGHLPIGVPVSAWELLSACVELQTPASRQQIRALAEHTTCPYTRRALVKLAGDDADDRRPFPTGIMAGHLSILELLERYPKVDLPFAVFLGMLRPLGPRYYSIASSPQVNPTAASITVGVLEAPARSGQGLYQGVCSSQLREALPGNRIQAFIRDNGAFRLPEDAMTPLLMIGPGTGLAPFRGFLQERRAIQAAGIEVGRALLFFGCRHPEQDYLYRDELEQFARQGVVELHTAFSRVKDQDRVYVQHRIAEQRDRVWELLEQGAVIYVCGDVVRMEPEVRAALCAIHQAQSGGSEADARAWLETLRASGRYLTDVWATSR